jgi:hypothetical protein
MFTSLSFLAFTVCAAAAWRLTHALVFEDGPGRCFARLRDWPALRGVLGCFYCCSVWAALPWALWLGNGWIEIAVLSLALSGGAIVIERLSGGRLPPAALWQEESLSASTPESTHTSTTNASDASRRQKEPDHVLLRP